MKFASLLSGYVCCSQTGVLRELANRMMVSMKNVSESVHCHRTDQECIINDSGIATVTHANMNASFQPDQDSEEENQDKTDTHSSICDSVQEHTHSIILDLSPVSFIDTVTLKTLKNVSQVTFIYTHLLCNFNHVLLDIINWYCTSFNILLDFARFCKG